jgi:hypothetical protein
MGNRCVFYDERDQGFVIGHYYSHGELSDRLVDECVFQLDDLVGNIINSRFVIS